MKEDFLHYVWKYQKFNISALATTQGLPLSILNPGLHNTNAGPDFFNSQISLAHQKWAGNIEIHVRSSHWYAHNHQHDRAYDSVILHVVWLHDAAVFRKDGKEIPTLELKYCVEANTLRAFKTLFTKKPKWIPCENDFSRVEDFVYQNWLERLFIERLEEKSNRILKEVGRANSDWEAVLFNLLSKNFGLKVNAESFYSIATSMDFSIVRKCSQRVQSLEALLLGQAGFLSEVIDDSYYKELKEQYEFQKLKFGIDNSHVILPKYFRLRPPNFPTVRLAQLAALFSKRRRMFSELIAVQSFEEFYELFDIKASGYWDAHYNFANATSTKPKKLTKEFIDLLLINTILPIRFCYGISIGKSMDEEILGFAEKIRPETNSIITKFNALRPRANNAIVSQGLLQLKSNHCDKHRCLECGIGNWMLKN